MLFLILKTLFYYPCLIVLCYFAVFIIVTFNTNIKSHIHLFTSTQNAVFGCKGFGCKNTPAHCSN